MIPRKTAVGLIVLAALLTSSLQAATSAKITAVILEVYWRATPTAAWARARVGTLLPTGAQVRTGKRSSCEIRFADGSVVRLAPQTDLTISKLASKDLSVGRGRLWAKVKKGSGGATVRGGNGVASIKGTTWTNAVTGDGFTTCVIDGEVHVSLNRDGKLTDFEVGSLEQLSPYLGSAQQLGNLSALEFIQQVFLPWYETIHTGDAVGATAARLEELAVLANNLQDLAQVLHLDPAPQIGWLNVDIKAQKSLQPAASVGAPSSAPLLAGLGWIPPAAMLEVPPLAMGQAAPTQSRAFGKRLLEPDVQVDVFGLWGEQAGGSLAGMRVRPRTVWNNLYFEAGATGWTSFEDGWHTVLSEAMVVAKPGAGKVTLGRQHFLAGPLNNSNLGTLLNFDTADGLRFEPRVGDLKLDLAYVHDFLPFRSSDRAGWYGRGELPLWGGEVGLNYVHVGGFGDGVSGDFSFPAVEGEWDLYGELGSDSMGNHLETWGSYFPGLYQRYDVDLFIEYARHRGAESLLSAYAYWEFENNWTGLLKLQHTAYDSINAGVGVIKRF